MIAHGFVLAMSRSSFNVCKNHVQLDVSSTSTTAIVMGKIVVWIYTNNTQKLPFVPCLYMAAISEDNWSATLLKASLASI
jgi:hypothetical protein